MIVMTPIVYITKVCYKRLPLAIALSFLAEILNMYLLITHVATPWLLYLPLNIIYAFTVLGLLTATYRDKPHQYNIVGLGILTLTLWNLILSIFLPDTWLWYYRIIDVSICMMLLPIAWSSAVKEGKVRRVWTIY